MSFIPPHNHKNVTPVITLKKNKNCLYISVNIQGSVELKYSGCMYSQTALCCMQNGQQLILWGEAAAGATMGPLHARNGLVPCITEELVRNINTPDKL